MPASSPANTSGSIVSIVILINGNPMPDDYRVLSFTVNHPIDAIAVADIVFLDGDPISGTFAIADSGDFANGNEVEIKAGYDNDMNTIFRGKVTRQAITINNVTGSTFTVTCAYQESVKNDKPTTHHPSDLSDEPILSLSYGDSIIEFKGALIDNCYQGHASFQGSSLAKPGKTVALLGLGHRFSKVVFINEVNHSIADANWITQIKFG